MKLRIKKRDMIRYVYLLTILYVVNFSGITTAFLSNDVIKGLNLLAVVLFSMVVLMKYGTTIKMNETYIWLTYLLMFLLVLPNSGWSLANILRYFGVLIFGIETIKSKKISTDLLRLLVINTLIYAFFTYFEFFNRNFYWSHIYILFDDTANNLRNAFKQGYMAGLTNHYSSNAMFLSCGILITATNYLADKKRKSFLLTLILSIALLLTGKRAHILFVFASLFVVYYLSLSNKDAINRFLKTAGVILLGSCAGLIIISFIPALSVFFERMQSLIDGHDTSSAVRLKLWTLAIESFKKRPFIGLGWKQFEYQLSELVGSNRTFNTHNVYLQLLCEVGIIGFSIYVLFFVKTFLKTIKIYIKMIKINCMSEDTRLIGFSIAMQTFFIMYCFTGNPLYDWKMNIPYFTACGIAYYYDYILFTKKELPVV